MRTNESDHVAKMLQELVSFRDPAVVAIFAAGCGTIMTRGGEPTFGGYPYQAVANDLTVWIPNSFKFDDLNPALPIISAPFDLVVDTALLPVDILCWEEQQRPRDEVINFAVKELI